MLLAWALEAKWVQTNGPSTIIYTMRWPQPLTSHDNIKTTHWRQSRRICLLWKHHKFSSKLFGFWLCRLDICLFNILIVYLKTIAWWNFCYDLKWTRNMCVCENRWVSLRRIGWLCAVLVWWWSSIDNNQLVFGRTWWWFLIMMTIGCLRRVYVIFSDF